MRRSPSFAAIVVLCLAVGPASGQEKATTELRIIVEPEGVELWQGSLQLGVTGREPTKLAVDQGRVTYRFVKEGYVTEERSIEIGPEPTTLVVRLKQREAPTRTEPRKTPASSEAASTPQKPSHTGLVLGVVGGAVAVGAGLALALHKTDPRDLDADHDGFTPNEGDCNDTDGQVTPRGTVTFTLQTGTSGTVNCRQPAGTIEVHATNLGCSPVNISNVQYSRTSLAGRCLTGTYSPTIPLLVRTLGPGARDQVIASRSASFEIGCCVNGFCSITESCTFGENLVVATDSGQTVLSNQYTIQFPQGSSCSACTNATSLGFQDCPSATELKH
jgi:hypothetical protein